MARPIHYFTLSFVLLIAGCTSEVSNAVDAGPIDLSLESDKYKQRAEKLPQPGQSPIGINVNALVDWTTSYPFTDIFKTARPFTAEREGTDLVLDDKGWIVSKSGPASIVSPMLWGIDQSMLPKGNYTVTYDGVLDADYLCAEVVSRDKEKHTEIIHIGDSECGLYLKIGEVDPNDPPRNIRIIMPGGICGEDVFNRVDGPAACDEGNYRSFASAPDDLIFNPDFLKFHRDFSVLRFMDAQNTNSSKITRWAERARPDDATWQKNGMPIEVIVKLANTVQSSIWIHIPHAADDDYVERLSQFIADNLDPSLHVYIEYSNEVWNSIFTQNNYAIEQGMKRGLDKENKYHAGWKFYSERSVEIFNIFEKAFGGTDRLVRVMGSQAVRYGMTRILLDHKKAHEHVDVLAIAAYFGGSAAGEDLEQVRAMDAGQLGDYLLHKPIDLTVAEIQENYKIGHQYDLPVVAYEGGQHLGGIGHYVDDKELVALFHGVNRHPKMKDVYTRLYEGWKNSGGTLFVHYAGPDKFSKWGSWGIKEYLMQPRNEAPKYDATLEFIEKNPVWW